MVELLVSMGIVGLLVSITLSAVHVAREKARSVDCRHRLASLSLGLANHEATHGRFPLGGDMVHDGSNGQWPRAQAPQIYLLPYLDQAALYNKIDLRIATERDLLIVRGINDANEVVKRIKIPQFLCPSDPNADGLGRNSYRVNMGISTAPHSLWQHSGTFEGSFFPPQYPIRAADFPDGLSQTVACSERLVGDGNNSRYTPATDFWNVATSVGSLNFGSMTQAQVDEVFAATCPSLRSAIPPHSSDMGAFWFYAGLMDTWYNHASPPNSEVPDCGLPGGIMTIGIVSARSEHASGVNVAFMDGSARFVANDIDESVWRAWSTRNGSEVANDE